MPWWLPLRPCRLDDVWDELSTSLRIPQDAAGWLAYPDTDLPVASVWARLVMASILEGSTERAELELELLRRLHPDASGVIAGQEGKYHELLAAQLAKSRSWPGLPVTADWPTLGGNAAHNKRASWDIDIARRVIWQTELPAITAPREQVGETRTRVAEHADALLSYHVAVCDGVIYIQQPGMLRALRLTDGTPCFATASGVPSPRDFSYGKFYQWTSHSPKLVPERFAYSGVPRYSLSVRHDRLFARMGIGWTGGGNEVGPRPDERSFLVGIDLHTQKLLFDRIFPDEPGWEFEASPLSDGARLYVSQRRRDQVNAQARVACFDVQTGRLVWKTDVVRGEVPSGVLYQLTNSALSLQQGRLYFSTQLGAVAALRVSDGRIEWLCSYRRAGSRGRRT